MAYPTGPLTGKLSGNGSLSGSLSTQVGAAPLYDGPYEVTPRFETQTLETRAKQMRDDVTVNEIPVVRTVNIHGGQTVVIG